MNDLVQIITIVLSLSIPIVAIICGAVQQIKKEKAERDIRQLVIEHQTDPETAKYLISEPKKPKDGKFGVLRGGCILIGCGISGLMAHLAGLDEKHDFIFWLIVALGMGVGLLVAFAIEWKMKDRNKPQEAELQ